MTYSVTIWQTRTYELEIDARTPDEAEEAAAALMASNEWMSMRQVTVETLYDAEPMIQCPACGEAHFGPACKKPASGETLLVPSWQRAKL